MTFGCESRCDAVIQGDKGVWHSSDCTVHDLEGNPIWKYDEEAAKVQFKINDMYTPEYINPVNHTRKGTILRVAETNAESALAAIMARESAYSGKTVTRENMVASDLNLMPAEFASGTLDKMDMKKYATVPLPSVSSKEA